ncbi:3',5'-cyclic-AMP phosphodiesterase [Agarivorans gilvus]|uniref:3',5'-cyclic adenosine monophosphate phosphodiesterase CpdA n=1 Tax=Agarivorans gilvus TaxID=680279 RepID=A0ABQ1I360_9ALTE|nr:3',5'-cyclic-AMP phosphodiesterase [Agarivorans gilvus]GGB05555.1 3',5'-cyclic adenosine monophosphate phosphodiesterase CpdA [Agarivorans gilvus]
MALTKLNITTAEDGCVHLLQVTDTHLFADEQTGLLGVNTNASFQAVLNDIKNDNIRFDYILATGDLSQDHSKASYQRFAENIAQLQRPCVWLPGNHDMQANMQTLEQHGVLGAKQLISEHWQVLMLDTQVEGSPHGMMSQQQIDELKQALSEYPDKHVLIAMHHQAIPVGSKWLDQHNLKNASQFFEVIADFPNVRGVVFGHVHQNYEFQFDGVAFIATPSTCIQFLPLSANFALDHQQPGWRYLQLTPEGRIATRLRRLSERSFLPDPKSKGY